MNDTMLYILIGVLVYVAFFRTPTNVVRQDPARLTNGGTVQDSPQNEFDKILGLIGGAVDSITGAIKGGANTSVQRN